ncbi:MFS transporter [Actinoplanes sp. NPDC049668]|uniref:MFS transporter n=1 Tax=unclassified Actinoplanes TaxID=2626549 RepID=UPI0033ADAF50
MDQLSRNLRWGALGALAMGGVAIGLTEFVAMGLLPEISRGLLPQAYAESPADAVAQGGWTITAYALGVVVGAPVIAAATARVPRRKLVLGLLALFVAGTVASAVAPTFGLVLLARFVAALPHGAYFGAAGLLAATLMGPGRQARGYAVVLSGLTAANIVGVPLITRLGQVAGWRVAYLVIAAVFLITLAAVRMLVPEVAATPGGSPAGELRALRTPRVWLAAATATAGFAGFFAVYSYLAPVTTEVAGLGAGTVPWVLVAMGLGMAAGNALGGWLADRDLRRAMLAGFTASIAAIVAFALIADTTAGLFLGAFLAGGTSLFVGPALQARLIQVAPSAQLMGAAVSQSALNLANSLGAALGGLVIARGLGYLAPAWVGVALVAVGLALAAAGFAGERRRSPGTPNSSPDSAAALSR